MAIKYQISKGYSHFPVLVTLVDGKPVNLAGTELRRHVPATERSVAKNLTIPAATQKQLEDIYKSGSRLVEAVEVEDAEKPSKPNKKGEPVVDSGDEKESI